MFASLLLIPLVYTCCNAFTLRSSDEELRGISLTRRGNDTMIFRYEAPRQAVVMWATSRGDVEEATYESFANGQGVSEMTSDKQQIHGVAYFMPGDSVGYFALAGQFKHETISLPHLEIEYSEDEIVYTPNEPSSITVQWTKLPGNMYESLQWTFIGLDPSSSEEEIVAVSSQQLGVNDFLSNVETKPSGQLQETSAEIMLQEQSGLVFLTAMYMDYSNFFMMNVIKVIPIHPQGKPVFPDNFLSFPKMNRKQFCFSRSACRVFCTALGPDIESLHLLDDEGNRQSELISYNSEWMYAAFYTIPTVNSTVTRNYTCTASNSWGQEKEHEIQISHNAY